jgi:hypothetical protein
MVITLQSSRFRWLRPGVLTLSKRNNTEISLSPWIPFYCLLILHNTVRVSGSVHYTNVYQFFYYSFLRFPNNCILCPFKLLISSVVKQREFCGFPKTFHLCFCWLQIGRVSLLSNFLCRIVECILLFVVIFLWILHGLELDWCCLSLVKIIFICLWYLFCFSYDSVNPTELYVFFFFLFINYYLAAGGVSSFECYCFSLTAWKYKFMFLHYFVICVGHLRGCRLCY